MMIWSALWSQSVDAQALAAALTTALTADGWTPYNPFTGMPGKVYAQTIKLLIAPPDAGRGWTRVIGDPGRDGAAALSQVAPCLWLRFDGASLAISAYADGAAIDPRALDTAIADCLDAESDTAPTPTARGGIAGLAGDALPDAVRDRLDRVDAADADRLFTQLSSTLMAKSGGDADAARALLKGDALDWTTPAGQRLRAILGCLGMSAMPDFNSARDAYQAAARRQRLPNAPIYPGDAEAMAAVPDALMYLPCFFGRS